MYSNIRVAFIQYLWSFHSLIRPSVCLNMYSYTLHMYNPPFPTHLSESNQYSTFLHNQHHHNTYQFIWFHTKINSWQENNKAVKPLVQNIVSHAWFPQLCFHHVTSLIIIICLGHVIFIEPKLSQSESGISILI